MCIRIRKPKCEQSLFLDFPASLPPRPGIPEFDNSSLPVNPAPQLKLQDYDHPIIPFKVISRTMDIQTCRMAKSGR